MKRWKRAWNFTLAGVITLLLAEGIYFSLVIQGLRCVLPFPADLVLVYSGPENRTRLVPEWNRKDPAARFLFSGQDYSRQRLETALHLGDRMTVEDRARTTDQNARYTAPLVRKAGAKRVTLALPWYHLPRALFLTRLYLMGSGVTVTPYATLAAPDHWWLNRNFYAELLKFWGSLARIGLSWFGVENWPRPESGLVG